MVHCNYGSIWLRFRDMTRDRQTDGQTDRHPHRFMIWPHIVGHIIKRQASSRALTASVAVLRTRRGRIVCDGLYVIRWRRRSNSPPDTTALVITTFSAAVRHRKTEPGGYFCLKLTLNRTPDPIRPTRRGPDPNRPTNGRKQGGACPGSFGGTPPETIGDSRTEFTL